MQAGQNQTDGPKAAVASCVRALTAANVGTVLVPEAAAYGQVMGHLFSSAAALAHPLCIVQPETTAQVATILKVARECGCRLTVRGGGCSPLCAGDGAVMIDLSAHLAAGTFSGTNLRMGGGATMGPILDRLASQGRLVPVGVSRLPGMGLALRGGVGYLTRSLGLTLDHIVEVDIVLPSGELLTLSERSHGAEADLWWAMRGAAPHFGVVTAVTFRSHAAPPRLFVERLVLKLDALPALLELAPALPRDVSASAVLGSPAAGPGAPVLFVYVVSAKPASIECAKLLTRQLTSASGAAPLFARTDSCPYHDMPPFDVPALTDTPKAGTAASSASTSGGPANRVFVFEKCPFFKALDAAAAALLVEAIRTAPTSLCRIDLQHCGGALADVAPTATAFWNRRFEWSSPMIGAWVGPEGPREACTRWIRQLAKALAPYTEGGYSVEIIPGLPETAAEVEQAFGGNLPRLRELKKKWDPQNLLSGAFPL